MNRILLIQPQPAARDRHALALRRARYEVRSAADATTGLDTAQAWNPHVVVLPTTMVDAAGQPVAQVLRAHAASSAVQLIGLLPPGTSEVRGALLAGFDDALPDDPTDPALLEAVHARLRRLAATPAPADARQAVMDALQAAVRTAPLPSTLALVVLQDADALAAALGMEAYESFTAAWRARMQALAPDAQGVFALEPSAMAVLLPPSTPQMRGLLTALAGIGQMPLSAGSMNFRARALVGSTAVRSREASAAALLRECHVALDTARTLGQPRVHTYDAREARTLLDNLELATHIQHAAEEGRFQLAYQPKVSLATGEVTSVEALIRWQLPTGEHVPPERLLAVADDAGLLDEVGTWALREACRQTAEWLRAGMQLGVSVNISAGQFRRGDFVDEARLALSESGLLGEQLTVEVSEAALAHDTAGIRDQLADVRVAGIRVSVEDLGTGALALPTLRTLPLDEVKVDRGLIARLPGTAQDRAAADLVLRAAQELHVPCVAEGVEDAAQWSYLAERGWDSAQGFYISRPLPPESVPGFAAAGTTLRR